MQGLFNEINNETEKQQSEVANELPTELPEAFQVLKSTKNHEGKIREEIVDTFMVDRVTGIIPIEKAKNKAKAMKRVFPDTTFYVVGIYKRIEGTY